MENIIGKGNNSIFTFLVYNNVFSSQECETISNGAAEELSGLSSISDFPEENIIGAKISRLAVLPDNWISTRIKDFCFATNNSYYRFDISHADSNLYLAEHAENNYFDWTVDLGRGEKSTRKLSIILFLTDKKAYSGGKLSFKILDSYDIPDVPQEQGSMLIFPSFLPYKTEPVQKGKNYTLLTWMHGSHFS